MGVSHTALKCNCGKGGAAPANGKTRPRAGAVRSLGYTGGSISDLSAPGAVPRRADEHTAAVRTEGERSPLPCGLSRAVSSVRSLPCLLLCCGVAASSAGEPMSGHLVRSRLISFDLVRSHSISFDLVRSRLLRRRAEELPLHRCVEALSKGDEALQLARLWEGSLKVQGSIPYTGEKILQPCAPCRERPGRRRTRLRGRSRRRAAASPRPRVESSTSRGAGTARPAGAGRARKVVRRGPRLCRCASCLPEAVSLCQLLDRGCVVVPAA